MIIRDLTLEMTEEAQKLVWLNYEEAQKNHPVLPGDCESFNPTAIRFWTKHFAPYTQSLVRRIDENAVG